ncbi:MAG TPA: hypothetical protein VMV82_01780 [Candidatus Dormibacteraeota bacterium]|nr:hypothetical protein [Candidatus Dormibacteraeota bacterium]
MFTFFLSLLMGFAGVHGMDTGVGPTGAAVRSTSIQPPHHARIMDVGTLPTG